jgi:hypothetical protein
MKVETISYTINWENFKVGRSFFIPCLNPTEALKEILKNTKRLKLDVVTKVVIEGGVRGIRVWRVTPARPHARNV